MIPSLYVAIGGGLTFIAKFRLLLICRRVGGDDNYDYLLRIMQVWVSVHCDTNYCSFV